MMRITHPGSSWTIKSAHYTSSFPTRPASLSSWGPDGGGSKPEDGASLLSRSLAGAAAASTPADPFLGAWGSSSLWRGKCAKV
jgi:hypothetical protein